MLCFLGGYRDDRGPPPRGGGGYRDDDGGGSWRRDGPPPPSNRNAPDIVPGKKDSSFLLVVRCLGIIFSFFGPTWRWSYKLTHVRAFVRSLPAFLEIGSFKVSDFWHKGAWL